ncbi:tetratricopeptide repeat protein [Flavobacterium ajazii]|uniref:tetratricopeptide repeat protein n=1 Tax=Flavobacterium ajazii TaxID=2692318 RepID=UPI0013D3B4F1|nr:tetratricopeptide repeat protein [Flavobacterium ajazii]
MNVTNYIYLINNPDTITEKQTEALSSVLNEFPYFQSARALRLKGLYIQNSFKYNYALKVTGAHTTDRSVLFDFINSETFTSIQGEFYDQKLNALLNMTVFDSEIVLAEEKKKTAEIRIDPIERSILDSIKEATSVIFEEPEKIEEKPTEPVIEQTVFLPVEELIPVETASIIEETPTIETAPITETAPVPKPIITFFDEIVEDEDEIEFQPVVSQLSEKAISVVLKEPQNTEEPKETEITEPVLEATEENPEIQTLPDFSMNEKHSFQEWLKLSKTEPIDRSPEHIAEIQKVEEEKKKKADIIDKFIENNPKISPIKQTVINAAVQLDTNKEDNSYLMTETLARVYLDQKKYTKAIQAYEILILKYPEKITFFADRISDIKILQQNNNNNN